MNVDVVELLAEGKNGVVTVGSCEIVRGEMVEHECVCPLDNYWEGPITITIKERAKGISDQVIRSALNRELESGPCGHDYDCCGCSIVRIYGLKKGENDVWTGRVNLSRNY
jgi:hypothetical protein